MASMASPTRGCPNVYTAASRSSTGFSLWYARIVGKSTASAPPDPCPVTSTLAFVFASSSSLTASRIV